MPCQYRCITNTKTRRLQPKGFGDTVPFSSSSYSICLLSVFHLKKVRFPFYFIFLPYLWMILLLHVYDSVLFLLLPYLCIICCWRFIFFPYFISFILDLHRGSNVLLLLVHVYDSLFFSHFHFPPLRIPLGFPAFASSSYSIWRRFIFLLFFLHYSWMILLMHVYDSVLFLLLPNLCIILLLVFYFFPLFYLFHLISASWS